MLGHRVRGLATGDLEQGCAAFSHEGTLIEVSVVGQVPLFFGRKFECSSFGHRGKAVGLS